MRLKVSARTVKRRQQALRGKTPARAGVIPEVRSKAPAEPREDRPTVSIAPLDALWQTVNEAPDDVTAARRLVGVVVHFEPSVGTALADGSTLTGALVASSHGHALLCIREPKDLADFVLEVTKDPAPFGYEADPGESLEDFNRAMAKITATERRRAVDLLEAALRTVRRQGPRT